MNATATLPALTDQTPAQIDEQLAEIWGRIGSLQVRIMDAARAIRQAEKMARYGGLSRIPALEAKIAELQAQVAVIQEEATPFEAEFARRGGWTRAFLVTNNGGHVHATRNCSTCYATTQFNWIIEFSGQTEDEVVEAAGERACTVCYPSAPVEVLSRPTRIFSEDEKRLQAEKAVKAAAKAAKDAENVIDPETGKIWFKTERGATNEVASSYDSGLLYSNPEYIAEGDKIVAMVAAKRGVGFDELRAELFGKAQAKFRKTAIKNIKTNLSGKGMMASFAQDPANWHESYRRIAKEEGLI